MATIEALQECGQLHLPYPLQTVRFNMEDYAVAPGWGQDTDRKAAWWKRNGASDGEVTELIGDKSERMGRHYTRHVESEVSIARAFERVNGKRATKI